MFEEGALTAAALDQGHGSRWTRDCERQTGNAGARADVCEAGCGAHRLELNCHQSVGEVVADDGVRLAHRRRRGGVLGEEGSQYLQRLAGGRG